MEKRIVRWRQGLMHRRHHAGVILRTADRQHLRIRLADQVGAFAEAAGDDHLAVLVQCLADGIQRFLHGRVDETAGVDHHGIRRVVARHDFVTLDFQLGEDAFGIDQRLGAAEADEADLGCGCGHCWRVAAKKSRPLYGSRGSATAGRRAKRCPGILLSGVCFALRATLPIEHTPAAAYAEHDHRTGSVNMDEHINLNTAGMHCIGAYLAKPHGVPKGGIVVVQEIFGINPHIRSVTDSFAEHGYTAIAPAFFDHVESGVELGYDESGYQQGFKFAGEVGLDRAIEDVASAAEAISSAGRIGVVGYCWGGTVALLAAQRLGMPAVSYYGARNKSFLDQPLKAPAMFHFGENDSSIPPEVIQQHREAWPDAPVHVYPGTGHAFNRDVDPKVFSAAASQLALDRTLAFFDRHLAGGK